MSPSFVPLVLPVNNLNCYKYLLANRVRYYNIEFRIRLGEEEPL